MACRGLQHGFAGNVDCQREALATMVIWPRLFSILKGNQYRAGVHGKVFRRA